MSSRIHHLLPFLLVLGGCSATPAGQQGAAGADLGATAAGDGGDGTAADPISHDFGLEGCQAEAWIASQVSLSPGQRKNPDAYVIPYGSHPACQATYDTACETVCDCKFVFDCCLIASASTSVAGNEWNCGAPIAGEVCDQEYCDERPQVGQTNSLTCVDGTCQATGPNTAAGPN